ncbi:CU044_5270 family protein [Streptomyces sp. NPDC002896]|uniref:CU044_5270 family protein n=1 Tax=Streptomyces sp. NPDC002896 TaxID=3154438 RepID=UPI0033202BF0
MDEMTRVRELRADVPSPDRARLAPGRVRLLDAVQKGERPRTAWARRHFVIAGVVAAVTAVAVAVSLLVGGAGSGHEVTPATSESALDSAAKVLGRAADTVEGYKPVATPGDSQWIYEKTMSQSSGGWPSGTQEPPRTDEGWTKYADPRFENWREGDDHSPRERFRFIQQLPDDPEALLEKARKFYPSGKGSKETPAEHDFRALSVLLDSYPMPPEGLAKLYRALATVPGVDVGHQLVKDVAGRDAIEIHRNGGAKATTRTEILIDAHTYEPVGRRWIVVRDYAEKYPGGDTPERPWKEGDIVIQSARLDAAVVDEKGQLP